MSDPRASRRSARSRALGGAAILFVALALALGATGCAGLAGPAARAQEGCWPRFPYQEGWLGGDAAYSVPLSPTRSLWLFGDSFIGAPGAPDRVGARLVHNSIAITECEGGQLRIRYFWGEPRDGEPTAFLERAALEAAPAGAKAFWWIFGGFLHEGRLHLGLLEVEASEARGPLALPFRFTGSSLATIDNPQDDPRRWRVTVLPLARGPGAQPVSAFVVRPPHLYAFAFLDRGDGRHPRVLTRLPLARLSAEPESLPEAFETWTGEGGWKPGLRPELAQPVMDDNAAEMSVRHDPALGRWLAVYNFPDLAGSFPGTRPSDAVWLRSAPALEGPWSARRLLFRIPELAEGAPTDPNAGCYAAKEQPQFSRPGSITFTYVCNLFSGEGEDPYAVLRRLQRSMDLYRPVAAAVTIPWAPGEHAPADAP